MAISIFKRKKDFVYLTFLVIHLPIMFVADLAPYYPTSLKPTFVSSIQNFYVSTYGDRFFYDSPPWFPVYSFLEFLLHTPICLWGIPALLRNDPRTPLVLLVFGLEVAVTTATCLAEMLSWEELTAEQRGLSGLGGMYGGYLALAVFMTVDCYFRVDQMVGKARGVRPVVEKRL